MYEIDELWTFIQHKKNPIWICYAIERTTKTVINIAIGKKTKKQLQKVVEKVLLLHPITIFTDKLRTYKKLIPASIHKQFKYKTNTIERYNLTLRTHIKRLTRRTICFSKAQLFLEAHLRIYFWSSIII